MRTYWVERAILVALKTALATAGVRLFEPGDYSRVKVEPKQWVELTYGPIDRAAAARGSVSGGRATRAEVWTVPLRCVVKEGRSKGGRQYVLSQLVDTVRAVVDATEEATGLQILDDSDPQECAGALAWKEAQETEARQYGTNVTLPDGRVVEKVDVAFLEARAVVRGRL